MLDKHKANTTSLRSTLNRSPLHPVRQIAAESFAPFSVMPNAKIPDLTESRRESKEERIVSLHKKPKHKTGFYSGAASQAEKLMSAPLTM
jgi:hypothetical protein